MENLKTRPYDIDDDLMMRTRDDKQPRVRVYTWPPQKDLPEVAVVIGRGGKQELELDREAISRDSIALFKRPGGGCAVVLDPGNVIVSVALPLPGLSGITTAFASISQWLAAELDALGIAGITQMGISDLTLDQKKIGGSCVYRTRDLLYYSTTLLVSPDLALVDKYLPHPPREPDYRLGRSHRNFMGQLGSLPTVSSPTQLADNLSKGLNTSVRGISDSLMSL